MNITAELITSILTQAGETITCNYIQTECAEDIIIRFEDETNTVISIYYIPTIDLLAIGTINSEGSYRNHTRISRASLLEPDTLRKYLIHEVECLEADLKFKNMMGQKEV